ncbi:MAG: MarR family transcriptional regulator, partial [Bradyrhizobium sp.]
MEQKSKPARRARASLPKPDQLAPVTAMVSSRLMVLANLLKRGAILRYRRTAGLSSVEFGLVASLGRNPPMSVIQLAQAVGMDKGQISRALAGLVERTLVARQVNPHDNREVLVSLSRTGIAAHEILLAGAIERTKSLLEDFDDGELSVLLDQIDRLTRNAKKMLAEEK